ncbi:MAG: hypothetical protein H0U57_07410 [Tatlockia sp.]|nr:hypothetical protein [Tatlockia sp.]
MNKHKLSTVLLMAFTLLTGCATVYKPPKATEPTSIIRVKDERSGLATWITLKVEAIDNKSAGLQLMPGKLRIYPGIHTLTVNTQFNRGFFSSGPFEAFTDINADFKAGETYIIEAAIEGSKVLVWISNGAGKKISPVIANNYRSAPQQNTLFIPVGR